MEIMDSIYKLDEKYLPKRSKSGKYLENDNEHYERVKKHLSNSFLVEAILQFGILIRKFFAFANLNKYIIIGIIFNKHRRMFPNKS